MNNRVSGTEQWLDEQIEEAKERYEEAETDSQSYQFAAEAVTYARIKNGTLPFGSPKESLKVYENQPEDPDFGMTAARIRAIRQYLKRFERCDSP